MNKEFVGYTQALALKELGFDEPCMSSRDMNNGQGLIQLPLYQQAFKWFREKHWLYPSVISHDVDNHIFTITGGKIYESDDEQDNFDTYEEAEQVCLDKLIEIVKTK